MGAGDEVPVEQLGSIFVDPVAYADPVRWHAAAARIRAERPVLPVDVPGYPRFWAITRHADVMEVERHPEVFTNAPITIIVDEERTEQMRTSEPPVKALVQMDGEQHRANRGIVNDWFKPGSVKRLQARIDELATHWVDRMASLGVLLDFAVYFSELAASRRADPTSDLASVIANAEIGGEPLSDMELVGHYVIIATAGHDTTSNSIAGGLLALVEQRDQLELLQADPGLIDGAADEIVRFVSPVKHFVRTCQAPFTLRDVSLAPGDLLLLSYASANRDDEVFEDPFRLDVTRANAANHLAFGFGRHFCLGAHLARMEVRALFRELLGRLDDIELDGEATWVQSHFVQGPKRVPVRYRLRPS